MSENAFSTAFNQLVEQLAEERLKGLQLCNIGDAEGTYTWDYDVVTSESCNRGDGSGWFPSALDALLDFVVWTQECNDDFIKQLCDTNSDI